MICGFATGNWKILGQIFPSLLIISNLGVLSLYLILLYWKKGYRRGAVKIIFICGVIANIMMIFIYPIYLAPLIYLPYLLLNLYRLHSLFTKKKTQEAIPINHHESLIPFNDTGNHGDSGIEKDGVDELLAEARQAGISPIKRFRNP